jgi:anti-anti-sigma factor
MNLTVRLTRLDSVRVVITVAGELDMCTKSLLSAVIDPLPPMSVRQVILASSGLRFCDMAGLRLLIELHHELSAFDGRVLIAEPPPLIHRLISLVAPELKVTRSLREALEVCVDRVSEDELGQALPEPRHLPRLRRASKPARPARRPIPRRPALPLAAGEPRSPSDPLALSDLLGLSDAHAAELTDVGHPELSDYGVPELIGPGVPELSDFGEPAEAGATMSADIGALAVPFAAVHDVPLTVPYATEDLWSPTGSEGSRGQLIARSQQLCQQSAHHMDSLRRQLDMASQALTELRRTRQRCQATRAELLVSNRSS